MIKISDVLIDIQGILLSSSAIGAFCQVKYGKAISVFVGADVNNLENIDQCPYVILDRSFSNLERKNLAINIDANLYAFFCIYQKSITGNVYAGVTEIDEFAQIARWEIINNISHPIEFMKEYIPSEKEETPLRVHPIYTLIDTAKIKIMEK